MGFSIKNLFNKQARLKNKQQSQLEEMKNESFESVYHKFAKDVKNADIEKLQDAVIEAGDPQLICEFAKNIEVDRMFYLKPSTSIILNQDNKSVKIAEVKKSRKTMWPNEYIHFNYRNIDINIVPITEKEFKFQTDKYNQWVEESIGSELELQ